MVLTNEIDQAIESCTNLNQIETRETTADLIRNYSNRAAAYDTARRYDEAIADYTKVIALAPDDAFNFEMRAGAYILKGLYDQAIADYTKAIALKPDASDVYYHRGSAYILRPLSPTRFAIIRAGPSEPACWAELKASPPGSRRNRSCPRRSPCLEKCARREVRGSDAETLRSRKRRYEAHIVAEVARSPCHQKFRGRRSIGEPILALDDQPHRL